MKKTGKIVFGVLVLLLVGAQFVPYGRNHSNPPVVAEPKWDSARTRDLFFIACADCHSNETKWPWYSHVAPISWLVQRDVDEGRSHFNVSEWGVSEENEGDEAAEEVQEGEMPLPVYLLAHPRARLSAQEKQELIEGLLATFGGEAEGDEDEEHEHGEWGEHEDDDD